MELTAPIRKLLSGSAWTAVIVSGLLLTVLSCGEKKDARFLKVGLHEEPKTLNIWLASDANSKKILSLIYQPLYLRDPETLSLIPWLASGEPEYDPATISYTVRLKPARWSDGSEVTSIDVAFTASLIKEFRIPRYYSSWKFIKKIETPDNRTVRFYLEAPKAIFLTRTLTSSIVSKKEWAHISQSARTQQKPLKALINHKIEKPMGCGPFVLEKWGRGTYVHLQKNRYFFGLHQEIGGRILGPYVNDLLFKVYGTADVAVLALKKGNIDMFWWGIQPGYIDDLKQQKNIKIFYSKKSALYFLGFNLRTLPFSDVNLRQAVAVLVDKEFIISRILQTYGTRMDSIVPPGNQYWFCSDVSRYGEGMDRNGRIKKAYHILHTAGYAWEVPPVDESGRVVPGKGIRMPDGQLMKKITILTPPADYDPHRAMSGMMIQEWLKALGIPVLSRPMAFGALLDQVKGRHEFDAFILGYGRLSMDPDYLRNFFHSANDKHRGWNMSGYNNPEFDRIAEKSASEMNQELRQKLIFKMQKIIMADIPYLPIYNPALLEAVRTDTFSGWVETLDGIGNTWSFCLVKQNDTTSR
ncbi:MAG: ABC transporter substrate-binding protein [Desulfobacterales bacterium]|nr:ABC transporter substrate-binding protein [Desulfobacterales bacterium]